MSLSIDMQRASKLLNTLQHKNCSNKKHILKIGYLAAFLPTIITYHTRAHQQMRYPNVTWRITFSVYLFTTELRRTCRPTSRIFLSRLSGSDEQNVTRQYYLHLLLFTSNIHQSPTIYNVRTRGSSLSVVLISSPTTTYASYLADARTW